MNAYAIIAFIVGLYNVVEYFYNIPGVYKLATSIFVSIITCVPAAISLMWAFWDLWLHPFSKVKFILFGLTKYFLADAFQDVIDYVDRIDKSNNISGMDAIIRGLRQSNPLRKFFLYILYSDPLTRAYKRPFYSYTHLINCSNKVDINGGKNDMQDGQNMQIEGAYNNAISIRGHRLCVVQMSMIAEGLDFQRKWGELINEGSATKHDMNDEMLAKRFKYCLHLDVLVYEKHKILSDEAAHVVDTMISWWSANPDKPIFTRYDEGKKTAHCSSLYALYCMIDDDIVKNHSVVQVGAYVHIG